MQYKVKFLLLWNLDKLFDFFNYQKYDNLETFQTGKCLASYIFHAKMCANVLIEELLYIDDKCLDVKTISEFQIIRNIDQANAIFCEILSLLGFLNNILLDKELFNDSRILSELSEQLILEFSETLVILERCQNK